MQFDLTDFITVEKNHWTAPALTKCLRVTSSAVNIAGDVIEPYIDPEDLTRASVGFQYSAKHNALRLIKSSETPYVYSFVRDSKSPSFKGPMPKPLKSLHIMRGTYKPADGYDDIFVLDASTAYSDTPMEERAPEDDYIIENGDIEENDLVSWVWRSEKHKQLQRQTTIVTGKVISIWPADPNNSEDEAYAMVEPISKIYTDVFPDKRNVKVSLDRLIIRRKHNAN